MFLIGQFISPEKQLLQPKRRNTDMKTATCRQTGYFRDKILGLLFPQGVPIYGFETDYLSKNNLLQLNISTIFSPELFTICIVKTIKSFFFLQNDIHKAFQHFMNTHLTCPHKIQEQS